MTIVADTDGSEDVNDFLQRIRELGDKRDKEDEERTRKLEEEILQGRRERQARRAGLCVLMEVEPALTYTTVQSAPDPFPRLKTHPQTLVHLTPSLTHPLI